MNFFEWKIKEKWKDKYIYDNNNRNIYMFIYKKKFKKMSTPF